MSNSHLKDLIKILQADVERFLLNHFENSQLSSKCSHSFLAESLKHYANWQNLVLTKSYVALKVNLLLV